MKESLPCGFPGKFIRSPFLYLLTHSSLNSHEYFKKVPLSYCLGNWVPIIMMVTHQSTRVLLLKLIRLLLLRQLLLLSLRSDREERLHLVQDHLS